MSQSVRGHNRFLSTCTVLLTTVLTLWGLAASASATEIDQKAMAAAEWCADYADRLYVDTKEVKECANLFIGVGETALAEVSASMTFAKRMAHHQAALARVSVPLELEGLLKYAQAAPRDLDSAGVVVDSQPGVTAGNQEIRSRGTFAETSSSSPEPGDSTSGLLFYSNRKLQWGEGRGYQPLLGYASFNFWNEDPGATNRRTGPAATFRSVVVTNLTSVRPADPDGPNQQRLHGVLSEMSGLDGLAAREWGPNGYSEEGSDGSLTVSAQIAIGGYGNVGASRTWDFPAGIRDGGAGPGNGHEQYRVLWREATGGGIKYTGTNEASVLWEAPRDQGWAISFGATAHWSDECMRSRQSCAY